MKIKSQQDFFAGLLFGALGLAFAMGALDHRLGPACLPDAECAQHLWRRFVHLSSAPGPGYFPLGLGIVLTVLGGLLAFKALTFETDGGGRMGAVAWGPLFFVVSSIVVFAFGLPRAGFFVSAGLTLAVAMMADAEVRASGIGRVWLAAVLGTGLAFVVVRWGVPPLQTLLVAVAQAMADVFGSAVVSTRAGYVGMVLARLAWVALAVLAVRRLPPRFHALAVLVTLYFVLIAGSVWVFAQGLGLPIPLVPTGFSHTP